MPRYGARSKSRLGTAHPKLQLTFGEVIKIFDCIIICGHRTNAKQAELYAKKLTKVGPGKSKHNLFPSKAIDAAPYWAESPHIRWISIAQFMKNPTVENLDILLRWYQFAGVVKGAARTLGYKIRWGGDWDGDFSYIDQTFDDLCHFEFIE